MGEKVLDTKILGIGDAVSFKVKSDSLLQMCKDENKTTEFNALVTCVHAVGIEFVEISPEGILESGTISHFSVEAGVYEVTLLKKGCAV